MPKSKGNSTKSLVKIDFTRFRVLNPESSKAFESLCYFLFCRRFRISEGLFRYRNQAGVETNPVVVGKETIGFQAKFFESSIDSTQVIDSIEKARQKHHSLTKIVLYINQEFAQSSQKKSVVTKTQQKIESAASKLRLKIEYFVPSNFEIALAQPRNLDLAQLFFGSANEFGFVLNSANPKIQTFLQSSEYLNLPLLAQDRAIKKPQTSLLHSKQMTTLIIGQPGCGKSILMNYLLRQFGGLSARTSNEMRRILLKNGAIPMLINLKDCVGQSLENLIRKRQQDTDVRNHHLGFIYLFDGLDELGGEAAEQVLSYLRTLEYQSDTKKIVLSCRSGSVNRIQIRGYLPSLVEWKFGELNAADIDRYFAVKKSREKTGMLMRLRQANASLFDEIKDILLVSLLWETIERLDGSSTIADLLHEQIEHLLLTPDHWKNIGRLNLLDDKRERLVELNQDIAYAFQETGSFRFLRSDLQAIIQRRFHLLDYRSTNDILDYLSNLFFESDYANSKTAPSYVYRHRRYQEFFLAQRLKHEFESNPVVLRRRNILSNRDFFQNLFLPYVRRDYEKRQNIVGLLGLNLIDVYLGRHRGYGADSAYYLTSSSFVPALVSQPNEVLEQLLRGETLQIEAALYIDVKVLTTKFEAWRKNRNDYSATEYLSSIWEEGVGSLLRHISLFWHAGKQEIAQSLLRNLSTVSDFYHKENFFQKVLEHLRPADPFWKQWEHYVYQLVAIHGKNANTIFERYVRAQYQTTDNSLPGIPGEERGNEKLFKCYCRVVLRHCSADIFQQLRAYRDDEFVWLLDLLSIPEFIRIVGRNDASLSQIRKEFKRRKLPVDEQHLQLAFFRALVGLTFTNGERKQLHITLQKLLDERSVDWRFHDVARKYALVSFALKTNGTEVLQPKPNDAFHYYNELRLYSALFASLIEVVSGRRTLAQTVNDYIAFSDHYFERSHEWLRSQISQLWAWLFINCREIERDNLIALKRRLLRSETRMQHYEFLYALATEDKQLFDRIVNENDLADIEKNLNRTVEYQILVDECFALSLFYSRMSEEKSWSFFLRGLSNSILRHGWRKDIIVSYELVDALEVLWRNNWETHQRLVELTNEVFELAQRVVEITDRKETWQGPYNIVEIVAKYDIDLAESLKQRLTNSERSSDFSNRVVTTILLAKVQLGFRPEEIERGMDQFRRELDYKNKPRRESYEEKLKIYISLAESSSYTEAERAHAFERAFALVEQAKKDGVEYFLLDPYFMEIKKRLAALCDRYGRKFILEIGKDDAVDFTPTMSEYEFLRAVQAAKSKRKLLELYKKLNRYEDHIVLTQQSSWQALLDQTEIVMRSIQPFIKMLEEHSFPHSDFYSANSPYLHFGVAVALSNPAMKSQAMKHLSRNTGHGGFSNMMKVYEVMGDKRMARAVFRRYLQICHFLVE